MKRFALVLVLHVTFQFLSVPADGKAPEFPGVGSRRSFDLACKWYNAGCLAADARKPDLAIRNYQEAIHLYPHSALFYHNMSIELVHTGQAAKAESASRRAIELDPSDYEIRWQYAKTLVVQNKLKPARAVLARLRAGQQDHKRLAEIDAVIKQIDAETLRK